MVDIVGSGRPLNELEVARLERDLAVKLPAQYRAFLLAHNGGAPAKKVVATSCRGLPKVVYGVTNAKPAVDQFFGDNVQARPVGSLQEALFYDQGPPASLTIGRTIGGKLVRLTFTGKPAGQVFLLDNAAASEKKPDPSQMMLVASSFDEFMENAAPELVDSGEAATDAALEEFEKVAAETKGAKVALPASYRAYLCRVNGGFVSRANIVRGAPAGPQWADVLERLLTLGSTGAPKRGPADLRAEARTYRGRVPPDTQPVAGDEMGNLILIGTKGKNLGKVFFWSHNEEAGTPLGGKGKPTYDNVTLVAESFDEFLEGLRPEK